MSFTISLKFTLCRPLRLFNHRMGIHRISCSTGTSGLSDDNKVSYHRRTTLKYESKQDSLLVEMDDSVIVTSVPQPASNNPATSSPSPVSSTRQGLYDKIESQMVVVFLSPKAIGIYKDLAVHLVFGFLCLFAGPYFAGGFGRKKSAPSCLKACEVDEGDVCNDTETRAAKKASR